MVSVEAQTAIRRLCRPSVRLVNRPGIVEYLDDNRSGRRPGQGGGLWFKQEASRSGIQGGSKGPGVPDIPLDPQPAVVSYHGQVLVFASEEHYQSDAVKRLCVQYDPIPLHDEKVSKKKKHGLNNAGSKSAPIELNVHSDTTPPPIPVRRPVAAAVSDASGPGPSQRPPAQCSLDSQAVRPQSNRAASSCHSTNAAAPREDEDRVPYDIDLDPDSPYNLRDHYPPPTLACEPVLFSPLKVPDELLVRK
ncbi:hypothetical protein FIBSPDRAFT_896856 [Athelia psychrophila]|uniref:Uncharacterized protein n=1 Tax=Athelia psychrophila TaxID=1759441 RepID=A0A166CYA2_9AGAM|nr:hypothetical protein FIBSPDRAFT_896856 [Fibularhizoctonia sp. CBS 109695]